MKRVTPYPWPEMTQPSPEQLGDWLAICTREERTQWAESYQKAHSAAADCWQYDHMKNIDRLTYERDELKRRNDVLEKAYLLATTGSLEDDLTTDDEDEEFHACCGADMKSGHAKSCDRRV